MIPHLPANERFPTVFSLRKNSELRTSWISALFIGTNFKIKNGKLQENSWNNEVEFNKFYSTAAMLIDDSENILERYQRMSGKIFGINRPPNPAREWTGDFPILHDLFDTQDLGMKQQINRFLSEASSSVGDQRDGCIDRSISKDIRTFLANEGGDMVTKGMARANGIAWTEMAGRALNDIERLMKHVEEK